MTLPAPHPWHTDEATLTAYAKGSTQPVAATSVEAHLLGPIPTPGSGEQHGRRGQDCAPHHERFFSTSSAVSNPRAPAGRSA